MLHLLLIEDNPANVLLTREGLRQSAVDVDVTIAYDGEQALNILERSGFQPDFIILDLNIPKLNGHAILEHHKFAAGPPVVVFTGSPDEDDRIRALAAGAND